MKTSALATVAVLTGAAMAMARPLVESANGSLALPIATEPDAAAIGSAFPDSNDQPGAPAPAMAELDAEALNNTFPSLMGPVSTAVAVETLINSTNVNDIIKVFGMAILEVADGIDANSSESDVQLAHARYWTALLGMGSALEAAEANMGWPSLTWSDDTEDEGEDEDDGACEGDCDYKKSNCDEVKEKSACEESKCDDEKKKKSECKQEKGGCEEKVCGQKGGVLNGTEGAATA